MGYEYDYFVFLTNVIEYEYDSSKMAYDYIRVRFLSTITPSLRQLVIYMSKANRMLVLTKQREVFTNIPNIFLGVDRLTQLSCLDYLGVKLDAHLT